MRELSMIFAALIASNIGVAAQEEAPQLTHPDLGRSSPFITRPGELRHGVANKAIISLANVWPRSADGVTRIRVCWVNPRPEHSRQRDITRAAVTNTWDLLSSIEFLGWDACDTVGGNEIRIRVGQEWPRSNVGRQSDNKPTEMFLNFDFSGPTEWLFCRQTADACIYKLAAHEFGHAIGFVHEQERPDTPDSCILHTGEKPLESLRGYTLAGTPYDPDSIMNYCNPVWNNAGHLSRLDVLALQSVYDRPKR